MANNVEVAGISIGIKADIGGLNNSLTAAKSKVDAFITEYGKKTVSIQVEAEKGKTWAGLEGDLNALVERVTKGHSVPINVDLHIEDAATERANLENIVKGEIGLLKIPLEIDYKAKAHVEVTWSWADGPPPGDIGGVHVTVQPGGGGGGGGKTTTTRGRRRATREDDEVVTPEAGQAPQEAASKPRRGGKRAATPEPPVEEEAPRPARRRTSSRVTARPQAPPPLEPEAKTGGIADMPTGTPQNAAKREKEAKIAAGTAAHQASAEVTKVWRDVTRATAMGHAKREVAGMDLPDLKRVPTGATGFQSEYVGKEPSGNIRFQTPQGNRESLLRAPKPATFEGIRPKEGRTYMASRGDPTDPRRALADPRSMAWFSPGEGFDPEVTRESRRLFNEAMAKIEDDTFKKLEPVFGERARRPKESEADYKSRLAHSYEWKGYGSTGTMSADRILGIKGGFKTAAELPEIKELEGYRATQDFGRFFGDPIEAVMSGEGTGGALVQRAEAMQAIRLASAQREETAAGRPLTEREWKAALSKGTQRARRLRSENTLPEKDRPEEALYVHLNALIGQAFAEQEFGEQQLRQEQATAQSQASLAHNEAAAAFTAQHGERPVMPGTTRKVQVPKRDASGAQILKKVIDRDRGLITEVDAQRDPDLAKRLGEWHTRMVPEFEQRQESAGNEIARLKDAAGQFTESQEEYAQRVADRQEDWDAMFRDFETEFESPRPGANRAPRPRARQKINAAGANVEPTSKQADIFAMRERMEQLEAMEQFGEEGFDPEELADLQEKLADLAAGGFGGSGRRKKPSQDVRIARAEKLVAASRSKLRGATDPAAESYYKRQVRKNQGLLTEARRGTTAERGLTGEHRRVSQEVRANVGFCEYCGDPLPPGGGHADHALPRAQGGGPENLVAACAKCNLLKGDQGPLEWLQNPKKPPFQTIDAVAARAAQADAHPERMYDIDVIDMLKGSGREAPIRIKSPGRGEVDPRRLVPFRELDREQTPRWQGDPEYLDRLTSQIAEEGIQEPIELAYGQGRPMVEDGNHRLAAALRLGLDKVPVRTSERIGGGARTQGRIDPDEVLRLSGAARRVPRSEIDALGGSPIEVPDVRDITEAMGLGRGGFSNSGIRTKITAGSRSKMQRIAKSADVEKAFALIGDRYIDAAGRVLNDVREVIELETDPQRTSKTGFHVSRGGMQKLQKRVGDTKQALLGIVHSHEKGLTPSEPGAAAHPGQEDTTALQRANQALPGFLSGIVNPSTREGMRLYGVGEGGEISRRAHNVAPNLPRMRFEPEQAQAASPVNLDEVHGQVDQLFDQLSDADKQNLVQQWTSNGIPLSPHMQAHANAQTQGVPEFQALFGRTPQGGQGPMVGLQQGLLPAAAIPAAQPGPAMAQVPPVGQAAAAARQAAAAAVQPPQPPQPPQPNFGFAPPPSPPPSPPVLGGGGLPPGQPPGTVSRFQRSVRDVREEALQAGIPYRTLQNIESQYETDYIAAIAQADQIAGQIQEDIGKTPVRAVTTAVGQFASQLLIRGEVGERRIAAQTLGRMFRGAGRERMEAGFRKEALESRLQEGLRTGEIQAGSPEEADLKGQIGFQENLLKDAESSVAFFGKAYADAAKGVAPLGVQMANLVTITGSMMVAGAAFQVGMQLTSKALETFGEITKDGVEAATGYNATLKRVQAALAEEAMKTGDVRGTVAAAFAQAGMEPSGQQRSMLEGQVAAVAATNRADAQVDISRALQSLGSQAPMAARFGIAPGLVRPTGGFLGTAVGAQQSMDEVIGNRIEELNPQGFAGPVSGFMDFLFNSGRQRKQSQQDYFETLNQELDQAQNTARFGAGAERGLGPSKQAQGDQADLLDAMGANEIAAAVRDGSVAIRDANGQMVTEEKALAEIVKDLGEALSLPSAQESYRSRERSRNAAMMGIEFGFQNRTQITNPLNVWRRFAAQPPLAFGTGWNSGDAASQEAAARFGPGFQDQRHALNVQRARGRQVALDLGVNRSDINTLEAIGAEIRTIQTDLADRSLAVNTAAYNQQLMVSKRNLSDLAGLTGKVGAEQASWVGIMEGANLRLSRENTRIGRAIQSRNLDLQQAQINFQLAQARFTTGGATPAEAAAAQRQAEFEAGIAQANLDASRTIFGNEGIIFENQIKIVDETNLRAFTDAVFAVQQVEREHSLDKYAQAADQYVDTLKTQAEVLGDAVDAQIERGMSYTQLAQDEIRQTYIESGQILTGVEEDIADAFEQIREDFDTWLGDIGPSIGLVPLTLPGNPSSALTPLPGQAKWQNVRPAEEGPGVNAMGTLFNTQGATSMIVGEAGTETVAVLRNPRLGALNERSGGGITIQFNNPVVREDADLERMARAVEEVLDRRARLVGLGR